MNSMLSSAGCYQTLAERTAAPSPSAESRGSAQERPHLAEKASKCCFFFVALLRNDVERIHMYRPMAGFGWLAE